MPINVMQDRLAGPFLDRGGAGVHAKHPDFGALGDGATNDTAALIGLAAAADEAVPMVLDAGTYMMDEPITGKALHIDCRGEVRIKRHPDMDPGEFMIQVAGSIGDFSPLSEDALIGTNVLTCPGLAGSLSRGDLVLITSDALFNPNSASGGREQGEQAMVRAVAGDDIYLSELLFDSYLTADSARIAKVEPGSFRTSGRLIIDGTPDDPEQQTHGIRLDYCLAPLVDVELRNITDRGVIVYSAFAPQINVMAYNAGRQDPGQPGDAQGGRPITFSGATMYGRATGFASFVRHAFASGSAPAFPGVPWAARVSMTAVGGGRSAVFDAHGATGSVYFEQCIAIGGPVSDPNVATHEVTAGFHVAARRNYLRDSLVVGCRRGVSLRSDTDTIDVLDVDGLRVERGGNNGGVHINQPDLNINTLRVRGLSGDFEDGFGVNLTNAGTITTWDFADIVVDGPLIVVNDQIDSVPSTLVVRGGGSRFDTPQSAGVRAVDIRHAGVTVVQLIGVESRAGEFVRSQVPLDLIELIGCNGADAAARYVELEDDVGTLRILGGDWRDGQNATTALVRLAADKTITNLEVAPSRVSGANLVRAVAGVGGTAAVTRIKVGGYLGSITTLHAGLTGAPLEVVAGSFGRPRILRAQGSPEGVVAATVGVQYQRNNGGDNTALYVKTSGTGDTGWRAVETVAP